MLNKKTKLQSWPCQNGRSCADRSTRNQTKNRVRERLIED